MSERHRPARQQRSCAPMRRCSEHVHGVADVARATSRRWSTAGRHHAHRLRQRVGGRDRRPSRCSRRCAAWLPALPIRIGLATGDVEWATECARSAVACGRRAVRPGRARPDPGQQRRALAGRERRHFTRRSASIEIDGDGEPIEMFAVEWQPLAPAARRPATAARPVPLPAALATAPPAAGRARSRVATLAEAWKRSEAGTLEVVLIGGEAGAGKTRLAAEFARHCHDGGASVLLGTCDAELALPYQPWVQALDHLLRSLPDFGRPAVGDRDLADLLVLLPQLERMLPGLSRPVAGDPETDRYLLFSAVDRVLSVAAHTAPTLILLDDVHWAGRQTLELLRHLVRSGSAGRVDDRRHLPRRRRRPHRSAGRMPRRPAAQRIRHPGPRRWPRHGEHRAVRRRRPRPGPRQASCGCSPLLPGNAAAGTRSSSASCGAT